MQLFDTHIHLDSNEFENDWNFVWQRARKAGVKYAANAGAYPPTWETSLKFHQKFPEILPCIGIHPMVIDRFKLPELNRMQKLLKTGDFAAISEIGLDPNFKNCPMREQERLFRAQLELGLKFELPLCLHIRKVHHQVLNILDELFSGSWRGIAHCFSGSLELAQEFVKRGFLISFAGPLTNPNAKKLHRIAQKLPLENIVVESDSPDLPPRHLKQSRNEPAFIIEVVKKLSELRNQSLMHISEVIFQNACNLFGI